MMENAHLPLENAQEPNEAAHQPNNKKSKSKDGAKAKKITFAENTLSTEISESQKSTYKDALSQPAPGLSHRQRMMWLQSRRTTGLWVNCDDCGNWRYLPHILDSHELPQKWNCRMNPDPTAADCSIPEAPLCLRDEEDLIHSQYSAGSLVWARMPGFPWWPAMVDDCPDVEQFYWLDGFSDIPTHYNVVFFDASDATRAWVAPEHLKPYSATKNNGKIDKKYQKRLTSAIKQANDADKLSLQDRLAKYSFITRFSGNVNTPRKVKKNELEKFKNKLKRKYNIAFSDESSSESDDETCVAQKIDKSKTVNKSKPKKVNKPKATPKVNSDSLKVINSATEITEKPETQEAITNVEVNTTVAHETKANSDSLKVISSSTETTEKPETQEVIANAEVITTVANETETTESTMIRDFNPESKQTNSMAVQIGSTAPSVPVEQSFDDDTSTTYVPGSENVSEVPTSIQDIIDSIERSESPNSDDFEF